MTLFDSFRGTMLHTNTSTSRTHIQANEIVKKQNNHNRSNCVLKLLGARATTHAEAQASVRMNANISSKKTKMIDRTNEPAEYMHVFVCM